MFAILLCYDIMIAYLISPACTQELLIGSERMPSDTLWMEKDASKPGLSRSGSFSPSPGFRLIFHPMGVYRPPSFQIVP